MEYYDEYLINNFKLHFPSDGNKLLYYEPIGYDCLEIILDSGEVLIYDDHNKSVRTLPRNSEEMTEEEFRREFGYRLRRIMEYKGVIQSVLSERTNIPQYLISEYINGKRTPSSYTLNKLSIGLKCKMDDLMYK